MSLGMMTIKTSGNTIINTYKEKKITNKSLSCVILNTVYTLNYLMHTFCPRLFCNGVAKLDVIKQNESELANIEIQPIMVFNFFCNLLFYHH